LLDLEVVKIKNKKGNIVTEKPYVLIIGIIVFIIVLGFLFKNNVYAKIQEILPKFWEDNDDLESYSKGCEVSCEDYYKGEKVENYEECLDKNFKDYYFDLDSYCCCHNGKKKSSEEIENQEEIDVILDNYEKNKCVLNEYNCVVENPGCACFDDESWDSINSGIPSDYGLCAEGELCDDKGKGCIDIGNEPKKIEECIRIMERLGQSLIDFCSIRDNVKSRDYCLEVENCWYHDNDEKCLPKIQLEDENWVGGGVFEEYGMNYKIGRYNTYIDYETKDKATTAFFYVKVDGESFWRKCDNKYEFTSSESVYCYIGSRKFLYSDNDKKWIEDSQVYEEDSGSGDDSYDDADEFIDSTLGQLS
jgi:hypothetical protein